MKTLIKTLVLIAATASVPAQADYKVYGSGTKSCGTWTSDKAATNDLQYKYNQTWLVGFVSGVGYGTGIKLVADPEGMFDWIDTYCVANPLKNIASSAQALVNELNK